MTLKYLRDLTDESLKGVYEHNVHWQYKWFKLLEENHDKGIRDKFVDKQFDMFTNNCKKCEKVLKERGLI